MVWDQALAERNTASELVRTWMRRHQEAAPKRLQGLLTHLRNHLFDRDLTIAAARRACDIGDHSISTQIKQAIGETPATYVSTCRLVTAAALLAESTIPIGVIGEVVGYSTPQIFSDAFHRWSKQRPRSFRKAVWAFTPPIGCDERPTWLVCAVAHLPADVKRQRAATLREIFTPPDAAPPARDHTLRQLLDADVLARIRAEAIWSSTQTLSWPQQRQAIRETRYTSPALFELLRDQSRVLGRQNRKLGVRVAKLALSSLGGSPLTLLQDRDRASLIAQGLAWLGNANRLALDFASADRAFQQARRALPQDPDPLVQAELLDFEGALRHFQRRFDEARDLFDSAYVHASSIDAPLLSAEILINRAGVNMAAGRNHETIEDLRRAITLLDGHDHTYLELSAYQHLILAYCQTQTYDRAETCLPRARALCDKLELPLVRDHLTWLEAIIARGRGDIARAERKLVHAQRGFAEREQSYYVALISLDLAMIYAKERNREALLDTVTAILPIFRSLGNLREGLAAREMLRQAMLRDELSTAVLRDVREQLDAIRLPVRADAPAAKS